MHLPKIEALDLRPIEVQVAEHNARGGLQLRVWNPDFFLRSMHPPFKWSAVAGFDKW